MKGISTMADTLTLPEGFTPIAEALPKEGHPVLAIRRSGVISTKFEVISARYMPIYRPLSPWRDICNDAVTDSGAEVLGWRYADDWLQAA